MHDRPCDNVQLWVICVLRNDPFGLFRVNLYFVEEHPDAVAGFDGEGKLDVSAGNVFEREICQAGASPVGRVRSPTLVKVLPSSETEKEMEPGIPIPEVLHGQM